MQLVPAETSLVVAGAWNPAILTPAWVLRHGLGRDQNEAEQVQVFLPAGQGLIFDFPRYSLAEFTFIVRPEVLIMNPTGQAVEDLARLEDVAAAMLDVLRHTPVNGIGHNFEYRDANPMQEALQVFTDAGRDVGDHMPDGWSPSQTVLISGFRKDNASVVVNVQRTFDAGALAIKFNFHHPLTTVEQALEILRGQNGLGRMAQNFEIATRLVTELYGGAPNE
jgi:hypothetical protein